MRGTGHRCHVHLIHQDKSESRCVLDMSHLDDDSDHLDEHGHHAPVLVSKATIREIQALAEYDRRQAEQAREREQADSLRGALAAWDETARLATLGDPRGRASKLIMAGDRLAELLKEAADEC